MFFKEKIALYSENNTKLHGTYNNHSALEVWIEHYFLNLEMLKFNFILTLRIIHFVGTEYPFIQSV